MEPSDRVRKHALAECENCSLYDQKYVPSFGPKDADIAICGEAPGHREVIEGRPFTGPSGQLLGAVLENYKIKKDSVFFTNVVMCRPPENRVPTKKEIACCAPRLRAELTAVDPKLLYGVGGTAASAIAGTSVKITSYRAGPPKRSDVYPNATFIPTFHPANCLRAADNFPHLVRDIGKAFTPQVAFSPPLYRVFDDEQDALTALQEINRRTDRIVIDIETAFDKDISFEHPNHSSLLCIGIGYAKQRVAVFGRNALSSVSVCELLGKLLSTKKVIAHNGKFDLKALLRIAPKAELWFDTMLAHYCLDERGGIHGLKYLAKEYLGAPDWDKEIKEYKVWADIPPNLLHRYNAYDVSCTWLLYERFDLELNEQNLYDLHQLLVRASNVLMHMEMAGLEVDVSRLGEVATNMEGSLERRQDQLAAWVKNPRSWKHVQAALATQGIETDSTDVEHLTAILDSPLCTGDTRLFLTQLLEYRSEQKLHATYLVGTQKRLYNGRVYPNFLLHGTTTGRLSCVAGDTLIEMPRDLSKHPDGVPISQINPGDWVYAFDWQRELRLRQVRWVGQTGVRRTVKVTAVNSSGHELVLRLTPDHLVRLRNGDWRPAGSLIHKWGAATRNDYPRVMTMVMRTVDDGYIKFFPHSIARQNGSTGGGTSREHRWVAAQVTGRKVSTWDDVHHKDGNRANNSPGNLEILSVNDHRGNLHIHPNWGQGAQEAPDVNHGLNDYKVVCVEDGLIEPVWDMEVDEDHNFIANGICVHNCRNPNLQNVPRGSAIKSLFIPGEGRAFVQADYSQLEYRVVTTLAQEPYLQSIFSDGSRDIFGELALSIFGPSWGKHHRQITKRIVHGSNYGMGPGTMADQINADAANFGVALKVTEQQAAMYQQAYFSTIPKVKQWRDRVSATLFKDHDDLVTHYGRHRRFWLITKENKYSIEKEGLAFVPQSTGSDICLTALLRLNTEYSLDVRLPVHDSIMAVCDTDQVGDVAHTMQKVMLEAGQAYTDYVPFSTEIQTSTDSWGALQ